ncbi:hypothetical protein FS749_002162 [Ceratobasidium sp. UAMH 11750]|nr:hypothetical protein FS749_002162 [Ceratobasidium sp. UAMH 11750]
MVLAPSPLSSSLLACNHRFKAMSGGRVQTIRDSMDTQALPTHLPPFYVTYDGPIQGVWKRYANISLILDNNVHVRFCKAYSWAEVRYVLAAQHSFKDLLCTKPTGWNLLYPVLLELFGSEGNFKIGQELHEALLRVPNPPPSLQRVLMHISSRATYLRRFSQAPSDVAPLSAFLSLPTLPPPPQAPPSLGLGTQANTAADEETLVTSFPQDPIDFKVHMRMVVLDYQISERSRQNEAEVLSRVIDRLTARLERLNNADEDDLYGFQAHNATDR